MTCFCLLYATGIDIYVWRVYSNIYTVQFGLSCCYRSLTDFHIHVMLYVYSYTNDLF